MTKKLTLTGNAWDNVSTEAFMFVKDLLEKQPNDRMTAE